MMKVLKELLKDWVVLLYIIIAVASAAYVIYALTSTHVVVESSKVIPNGSVVYGIEYPNGQICKVNQPQDFYKCITNNTTLTILTNNGPILVLSNETKYLYETKVIQQGIIKLGIDLAGGTRVILKPTQNISLQELQLAANVIEMRLNSYGLKSIDIRVAQDMEGHGYIIIDLPSSEENLIQIIKKQGKFEAKIGNVTVFTGRDIKAVHTFPPEGGVFNCERLSDKWVCKFAFTVYISQEAAKRFAQATKNLSVVLKNGEAYLSKPLTLYIDNKKMDQLLISADLKGKVVDRAEVSGPGYGLTERQAANNALKKMKELATILSYGSLPTTFKVVRIEKIPPTIGEVILSSVILAGFIAFFAVWGLVYLVYRRFKPAFLIVINMLVEIIVTVAIGILLGQTFDLPALAGILIAIGTGVDDQIIAIEEVLQGKKDLKVRKKIWKVLFIVVSSFLVMLFAMFPLLFAGLGLLRGFAIMTIIGAFIGAFLTRPAFVKMAEKLL